MVSIRWRDHFHQLAEGNLSDVKDDCVWVSVGYVVRNDDRYLVLARDQEETQVGNLGAVIALAHALILEVDTLEEAP